MFKITRATIPLLEIGMRVKTYGYMYGIILEINTGSAPSMEYIVIQWDKKYNYNFDCGFEILELDKEELVYLINKLEL